MYLTLHTCNYKRKTSEVINLKIHLNWIKILNICTISRRVINYILFQYFPLKLKHSYQVLQAWYIYKFMTGLNTSKCEALIKSLFPTTNFFNLPLSIADVSKLCPLNPLVTQTIFIRTLFTEGFILKKLETLRGWSNIMNFKNQSVDISFSWSSIQSSIIKFQLLF